MLYCKVGTMKTWYSFFLLCKDTVPCRKEHESMIFESLKPRYYTNNCLGNWNTNDTHVTISILSPPDQVRTGSSGGYKQSKMLILVDTRGWGWLWE